MAVFAQSNTKEILFTIDDKPYFTDEFVRIYKKNIDLVKDESQKDLDLYLDLFVGYKLKINKAYRLGLDKNQKYITELNSYRTQLSKNYLTDSKVTKELVEEGYLRSLTEIKASHILLLLDENAPAADTLKVYNQILEIRKKAIAGEDFGKLAEQNSQDTSAKENKGDLGYFSAFRMVYAFETGAYNTKQNEISMPVRTRFGYHLIKVTDIRANRGDLSVEHIMILNPEDKAGQDKAKSNIEDIYKKLQQGENFEALAKQFSEDKSSSNKGGLLGRFGSGQLSSDEFENAAYSLSKENPLSAPFLSQFGWHVVKFIEKYPVKTLEEMQTELENKISKDDRSRVITNSVNEKLRKEFPIKRDDKLFAEAAKTVTADYIANTWKVPADTKKLDKNLFQIADKNISGTQFLKFLDQQQKTFKDSKLAINNIINTNYEKFVDQELNTYYNDNLENKFPEFANVMSEYRDGLLLFDLMEKEIWDKSKTDTLGLDNFYKMHKNNYLWKNRMDVTIVSSTKQDIVKKAQKMLQDKQTGDAIKAKFNTDKLVEVMLNQGIFEQSNEIIPTNVKFEEGVSDVVQKGDYYFATRVNKLLPEGQKNLEECKGKAINDFQQFLEENWVSDLKKEFLVKVDKVVFEKVKQEIKN